MNQIENCISPEEVKLTVGWYLAYGAYIGLEKKYLMKYILDFKELHKLAETLTEEDISSGRNPPSFRQGDIAEVVVNIRNSSYHKGEIHKIIYHFKEKEWNYYISENGKKISKRYYYRDLRLIEKAKTDKKI